MPRAVLSALVAALVAAGCSGGRSAHTPTTVTVTATATGAPTSAVPTTGVAVPAVENPVVVPAPTDLPSLPVGATVYVAPGGDDAADGSSSAPVRTIARAVDLGARVVRLAPGTYHESVRIPGGVAVVGDRERPDTVVIDGAWLRSRWQADGGVWSIEWERAAPPMPNDAVTGAAPEAALPEIVVLDGRPLRQLADGSRPGPGEFAVVDGRLTVADDPTTHQVEVADLASAVEMSDGSRLSGVTVARWGTPLDRLAAIRAYGDRVVVDHVVVRDNAAMGLSVIGEDVVVSDVSSLGNGYIGVHAHESTRLVLQRVTSRANNASGFDPVHSGAGIKITETDGLTVLDVVSSENDGPGLWTDLAVHDAVIARATLDGNVGSGLLIELSGVIGVVGASVSGTRGDVQGSGVWVLESNDVRIEGGVVADNDTANGSQVWVQDGPRTPDPSFVTDPAVAWDLRRVQLRALTIGGGSDEALVRVDDWTGERSADDLDVSITGTVWTDTTGPLLRWGRADGPLIVTNPDEVERVAAP